MDKELYVYDSEYVYGHVFAVLTDVIRALKSDGNISEHLALIHLYRSSKDHITTLEGRVSSNIFEILHQYNINDTIYQEIIKSQNHIEKIRDNNPPASDRYRAHYALYSGL